ncbi:hypothetical protein [Streptomyces sp. NPDC018693]|uniref:hypothetical protein n=1 Tax=unclassified Streptomyces TaxID=2593676 RepID=UPI00378B1DEB
MESALPGLAPITAPEPGGHGGTFIKRPAGKLGTRAAAPRKWARRAGAPTP